MATLGSEEKMPVTHFYLGVLNNSYLLKIIIRKKGTT